MDNHIPELNSLLTEVERKYGRRVATSTDFESLSAEIERMNGDLISASTLKRLWGYVNSNPTPRGSTLDILCRYIGERNFNEFCNNLKKNANVESGHFTSRFIATSELSVGQKLLLGWNPDRLVQIVYLGDFRFRVLESHNAQLQEDDEFEATNFSLGFPLYLPFILRGMVKHPSYVAGSFNGLTTLEIL
ncbi:MAG: hypothetical protein KBS38_04420 [Bacteroidales bacterium]|nr:hypothetical protein [Candidatus Cacconaster caballi]